MRARRLRSPIPTQPGASSHAPGSRKNPISSPIQVGKYLVSPLTRRLADDRYASSVSIKTGSGRASHDRVVRFSPVFATPQQALHFAADQGLEWLRANAPAAPALHSNRG
jgi:hypothetical protein